MGSCASNVDSVVPTTYVDDERDIFSLKLFNELHLSKDETYKLRNVFNKIVVDSSGEISSCEFLKYFGINDTLLHNRLFVLFDFDKSGSINFVEFISAMYVL